MQPIDDGDDAARRLDWLPARCHGNGWAGLDAGGWTDSIWLLHAMFERPSVAGDGSQVGVEAFRQGGRPDDGVLVWTAGGLVDTGIPLGYTITPSESHSRRLLWREWSDRCGRTLGDQPYAPGYSWFPDSFPANIQPPAEGSLDELTWGRLLGVLRQHSGDATAVTAYYAPAAPSGRQDAAMFAGMLPEATDLLTGRGLDCTPSNLWPDDRSWFVYTDADLMATKVSGSCALIAALKGGPHLETLRWEPPARV